MKALHKLYNRDTMTRQEQILQHLKFVGCPRTSGQIAKAIGVDSGSDVSPELAVLLAQSAVTAEGKRRGVRYALAGIPHSTVSPLIAVCEQAMLAWLAQHGECTGPELIEVATAGTSPAIPDDIAQEALESIVSRGEVEARGKARARRYIRHISTGSVTAACHTLGDGASGDGDKTSPAPNSKTTKADTHKTNSPSVKREGRKLPPPTIPELIEQGLFHERQD